MFRLSFWRHPFTAEDTLANKSINAKFLQICSDKETNSSHFLDGPRVDNVFLGEYSFNLTSIWASQMIYSRLQNSNVCAALHINMYSHVHFFFNQISWACHHGVILIKPSVWLIKVFHVYLISIGGVWGGPGGGGGHCPPQIRANRFCQIYEYNNIFTLSHFICIIVF